MPGRFYEDFFIFSGAPLAKLGNWIKPGDKQFQLIKDWRGTNSH